MRRRRQLSTGNRGSATADKPTARSSPEELRKEARRRIRAKRGIFASLTAEEREEVLSYDGPDFPAPLDSKCRL